MKPMLTQRTEQLLIEKLTAEPKVNDVVLFRRSTGQYVLHRIIGVTDDGYIFSGDNQAMREPVAKEQFIAVMESFNRNGKHYSCDAGFYRLYQTVWVELFFLRPLYIAVRRACNKLRRCIGKIIYKK